MNVIVTGASSGIGYEAVKILSEHKNYRIIAVARSADKLEALRKECSDSHGTEIDYFAGDLADEQFMADFLNFFRSRYKQINILLNNAGQLIHKSFDKMTRKEMEALYSVNVFGTAELIKIMLPYFEKGKSHVVNIASMGGFQGSAKFPGLSGYSSSKAALANLTECLAEEYKDYGIKFNCLALGAVQTEMLKKAFPDYQAPTTASQMGRYIVEFCMNGNNYFNGKILPVSISTP